MCYRQISVINCIKSFSPCSNMPVFGRRKGSYSLDMPTPPSPALLQSPQAKHPLLTRKFSEPVNIYNAKPTPKVKVIIKTRAPSSADSPRGLLTGVRKLYKKKSEGSLSSLYSKDYADKKYGLRSKDRRSSCIEEYLISPTPSDDVENLANNNEGKFMLFRQNQIEILEHLL